MIVYCTFVWDVFGCDSIALLAGRNLGEGWAKVCYDVTRARRVSPLRIKLRGLKGDAPSHILHVILP